MRLLSRIAIVSALAACCALTLGAPLAHGQAFGKNKIQYKDFRWETLHSAHFDVYYYQGGRRVAERVVAIAERANVHLSRDLDHRLTHRVPILVYASHNDFAQTNVTDEMLDEGTGGFTEVLKSRVVIPFTGSYEELRHVLVHELTHAFQFDILYGGSLGGIFGTSRFIDVPLWFGEGMAEYESLQMEPGCEQFMRDGIIHGYIVPLEYEPGGYLVYKEGQSVMAYIQKRYGREKYAEVLHRIRSFRGLDRALERTLGVPVKKLSEDWIKDLKRQYWPQVATLDDPEKFARRLTDHAKENSYLNAAPAISPDGGRVAYLSDRRIYTDLYLMSAIDGKILKRLVRGSRSRQFENIPSFRSSLSWSPDGTRLAFVAKSGERDEIYIYNLTRDDVEHELSYPFDAIAYPAFSPDGRHVAFEGLKDGRNDIYVADVDTDSLRRLTDDDYDEKDLTYAPDGRLTFSSDRHAPIDLWPVRIPGKSGTYGIYTLDPGTGEIREVLFTGNDDAGPAWSPDGTRLAFISQRGHGQNLAVFTPADSSIVQVTDVIGGIYSASWSRQSDRLVFSALNKGGWDVFASRDSLASGTALHRLGQQNPGDAFRFADFSHLDGVAPSLYPPLPEKLAPDSARAAADSAREAPRDGEPHVRTGTMRPVHTGGSMAGDTVVAGPFGPIRRGARLVRADSLAAEAAADTAGRLAAEPYHPHFSADYLTGGFQYNSVLGFGGSTQFALSDFLGDRRFFVATDLFTASLSETNVLALYNYLPRRVDLAAGLFHFKNYYFSRVSSLGEQFSEARYFSERNYGVISEASYPFDKFRRLDFDLSVSVLQRDNLDVDSTGYYLFKSSDTTVVLAAPTLSFIHDNTLYGWFGPIDGTRWNASVTQTVPLGRQSLSYRTLSLDYRNYTHLGGLYSLAFRTLLLGSFGPDPQHFFLGGPTTLRGYDDIGNTQTEVSVLAGSKAVLGTVELRFPFISHLALNAPLPISLFNIEGVAFADAGAAWDGGLRVFSHDGGFHFVDPRASYGVGIRAALAYFLIHLDVAWPTQATSTNPDKNPRWHFSIGPEF